MEDKLIEYMGSKKVSRTYTLPVEIDKKIRQLAKDRGIKKYQVVAFAIDDAYRMLIENLTLIESKKFTDIVNANLEKQSNYSQ